MLTRNYRPESDKRFMPLHRPRAYRAEERRLSKYVSKAVWFTNDDFKDKYRNCWKNWIVRKDDYLHKKKKNGGKYRGRNKNGHYKRKVTTAIFIPKTSGGKLVDKIQQIEDNDMMIKIPWRAKLVEKPGMPYFNLFNKKFHILQGCYRGSDCMCEGKGTTCMTKGVVYQATCKTCGPEATYIGETARQLGIRTAEHIEKAITLNPDSFIIDHWMNFHPTDSVPPAFKFRTVSKHSDALGRQVKEAVMIRQVGALNKRNEFAVNKIIRLEPKKYSWDEAKELKQIQQEEKQREECLKNFIQVMSNVMNNNKDSKYRITIRDNGSTFSRLKTTKRSPGGKIAHCYKDSISKKLRMNCSTPISNSDWRDSHKEPESSPIGAMVDGHNASSFDLDPSPGKNILRTDISNETSKLDLDPNKVAEPLVEVLAQQAVTVASHREAKENFIKRMLLRELPGTDIFIEDIDWGAEVRFNKNVGDTRSFEVLDLSNDDSKLGLDCLFNTGDMYDDIELVEDMHLDTLFLEDHFNEETVNQQLLIDIIEEKKRNKLPEILKLDGLILNNSQKRKRSPEDIITKKLRRMTYTGDASPRLKQPPRNRTRSVNNSKDSGARRRSTFDPAQRLITDIYAVREPKNPPQ